MYREIKIFTELERAKHGEIKEEHKDPTQHPLNSSQWEHNGLPNLLGYAIQENKKVGELLMTNGGKNLKYW